MSDYRFEIMKHHDIPCLHVMIDAEPIAEIYIPLDEIVREASWRGFALYNLSDAMLQKVCESQGYTKTETSPLTGQVIHSIEDKE